MDNILVAIKNMDYNYIKKNLKYTLVNYDDKYIINIIYLVLTKYNEIKNTYEFDNCRLLNYIIFRLNKIKKSRLRNILTNIKYHDNNLNSECTLLDFVYRNNLFFEECDLATIFYKNKVKLLAIDNFYLTYVFNHYKKLYKTEDNKILYEIIKHCKIIENISGPQIVIDNLIYMFQSINKEDYTIYNAIYLNLDTYDKFYNINKHNEHIKYFMINILFFTMLEKVNYKSLYNLMETILYNRELLSYLRHSFNNEEISKKYQQINNIAKQSIFISSEHQILLNKMIDVIFDHNNSTVQVMNTYKNNKNNNNNII